MTNELKDFLREAAILPGILLMILGAPAIGRQLDSQWSIMCFTLGIIWLVYAGFYRVRRHLDAINKRLSYLEYDAFSERLAPLLKSQTMESSASSAQEPSAHADSLDHIERIITIIRSSKTVEEAETNLIREFGFSEIHAREILDLRIPTALIYDWPGVREGERKGPAAPLRGGS